MSTPGMKIKGSLDEAARRFNKQSTPCRARNLTSTVTTKFINNTRKDNQPSRTPPNERNSANTFSGDKTCPRLCRESEF